MGAAAPPAINGKCKVVMVSSYLDRPLRTLEQAVDDRASRRAPTPAARYADSHVSGPDSVELLVRLLTENTDPDGALETPTPAPAAGQRSPLDRYRAA